MAKISLEGALTAAAIGGANVGAKEFDKQQGNEEPFQNATDIMRASVTIGSLVSNIFVDETRHPRISKVTEAGFYAGLPLLIDSGVEGAKAVAETTGIGTRGAGKGSSGGDGGVVVTGIDGVRSEGPGATAPGSQSISREMLDSGVVGSG